MNKNIIGHLLAVFTIFLWGMTFISTKVLLTDFTPLEILVYRFVMGTIALHVISFKWIKGASFQQEISFAAAGLCGVTLYFLVENIALTYTSASNVALLASCAPFFTIILSSFFLKEEALKKRFFVGFLVSITGIALISFNGATEFHFNPKGDFLAIAAAVSWAAYSVISKKITAYGYSAIQATQRVFVYGLFFMLFALPFLDCAWKPVEFMRPVNFINFLFLGLGASALCFVTWSMSLHYLGAIKASLYIYLVPVITVIAAIFILKEPINWVASMGIILTILGLMISTFNWKVKRYYGRSEKNCC